jgi:serine/threonine-protein kinase
VRPERWQQVSQLFQSALEREPNERAPYLQDACGDDDALRRQVESLLAAHNKADDDDFINAPAAERAAPLLMEEEAMTGELIGRYKILRRLGAGGMGEVYLAEDATLGRPVALKVLLPEIAHDQNRIRRFIQEAKSASALNHPNILTVYEVGDFESSRFIVTEFIKGKTLRERLGDEPLALRDALDIALQVAAALNAAHEANIIHRDIKPENIMLRDDGLVKVLDFGLAKLTEQRNEVVEAEAETRALVRTAPGVIMGTAAYMSPEQARGKATDARTDIFSFGVVLYEMLAGQQPFAGETMSDTIAAILKTEPAPLSLVSEDVPKELERIVGRTLRKNPDERYQHIKDLLIDLRDLKQELDFTAKLERSAAPSKATADKATTIIQSARTTPNTKYLAGEIKNHQLAAITALLVLSISGVALYYFTRGNVSNIQTSNAPIDSIAVLPFANAAQDPNAEYLSDGIAESLTNRLSQLSNLKVMSSSSVSRYKGKEQDAQKVGNELNVRAVLTGSVKQIGDQLVINVSLDDAKDNHHIWGEQYVRKFADVLAVQSEIAQEVSTNLRLRLTGTDKQQLAKRYTDNVEAYQLYLKGQYEWKKHTQEDLQKGIEYYNQAKELDPNYALAYFGLSASYGALGNNYLLPNEAFPKSKAYAAKALAIDDTLAEAHAAMGAVRLYYDWDWAEAEREFKRAQSLDPKNADAHHLYADSLEIMGRFDEAKAERKRALELDPLSPIFNMADGATLYFARQNDEAIAQYEKTINLEPRFVDTYFYLGQAYEQKKMYAQAIATYQKGITQSERNSWLIAALGHAYALTGERDKAQQSLAELREMSQRQYISPYLFAIVYAGLGDKEQAFAWLDKAYQDRSFFLIWLKVEPLFDPLRDDPRFQDLLRRVGLIQ